MGTSTARDSRELSPLASTCSYLQLYESTAQLTSATILYARSHEHLSHSLLEGTPTVPTDTAGRTAHKHLSSPRPTVVLDMRRKGRRTTTSLARTVASTGTYTCALHLRKRTCTSCAPARLLTSARAHLPAHHCLSTLIATASAPCMRQPLHLCQPSPLQNHYRLRTRTHRMVANSDAGIFVTSAQGEGSIEGKFEDYIVDGPFATDFPYGR